MNEVTLAFLWYLILGVSVVAYVALDGFDLGVGILNFFTKKDQDRRVFLNAIGPVWDGNEVWLVIVGGALFAGFPEVYATLFSGFYALCMILIAGLIFRAVSIEFRSKRPSVMWRKVWDTLFSVSSLVISFSLGLVFGNLMDGIPLDQNRDFVGTLSVFFRPFPILVGLFTVSLMTMHGGLFLIFKTEGALHDRLRTWTMKCIKIFLAFYVIMTIAAWTMTPHLIVRFKEMPILFLIALLAPISILCIPKLFQKKRDGWAFLCSCFAIFLLFLIFGIGTFPYLVRSTIAPDTNSLTFYNAAASRLTLTALLIIVAIGVPAVLAYGTLVYRVFRGKVKIEKTSY